jgi:hypothetical protein
MTTEIVLLIFIALAIIIFLIIATKKHWVSWKGTSGIAAITAFHDFLPKDKQTAIEIIVEQKAHKKMEEQESGQGKTDKDEKDKDNESSEIHN